MSKTVVIKRFGNAKAIILPESMMEELEMERGSRMTIALEKGQIVLTPIIENNLSLESLLNPVCSKKKASSK